MSVVRWLATLSVLGTVTLVSAQAAEFYVSPTGSASANGSVSSPWNLATALAHPPSVKPGDTIWLRGGTYKGTFVSKLAGSADKPIYVRQYPGERATLDGNGANKPVLSIGTTDHKIANSDTWYWGFEITNSNTNRADSTFTTFCPPTRCHGIYTYLARRVRFINLVIHDNALGIGAWIPAQEVDMYGNLIYHNGWEGTGVKPDGTKDRAHGHAIYTQNNVGQKMLRDNVIFNQFDNGIQVYTGGGSLANPSYIDNYLVEGNTSFNNGSVSSKVRDKNILVGGGLPAKNPVVTHNYTYHTPKVGVGENSFGYKSETGWVNGILRDNYFVGGRPIMLLSPRDSQVYNNFGYGGEYIGMSAYPNNTLLKYSTTLSVDQRPTGDKIFVRPNAYEPGRANVTIFNWDLKAAVDVDLSAAGLKDGEHFEVRDAQNFYGDPVAYGIYSISNTKVRIPMIGLTAVQPIGQPARPAYHTAPEFGAFIVLPRDTSAPPPPPVEPPPPVDPVVTKVSAPVFSPNGGTFSSAPSVSLMTATSGAVIRYTTDGSTPGTQSTAYAGPFSVTTSRTVKAIAIKDGMLNSDVVSAAFTINVVEPPPTGPIPTAGLKTWLRADAGVTLSGSKVARWDDQSANAASAAQTLADRQPVFVDSAANGKPALQFDGVDDMLSFRVPVNGLTGMTIVMVSANTVNKDGTWNGVNNAPLLWAETQSWGSVHLSPFQSSVKFRFGTRQSNNLPIYTRPASAGTAFGLAVAVKNGTNESLYVDGQQVYSAATSLATIAGTGETASLGGGFAGTYFPGMIAEVMVYDRALTDAERTQIEAYLTAKYLGTTTANKAPVVSAGPDRAVVFPATSSLAGSATDDGKPGPLSMSWIKTNGPGTVTFSNPTAAVTSAAFSTAGTYVLRLTATDGDLTTSDDVVVTVTAAPALDITPPLISAVAASTSTGSATITWTTSEPAVSQVEYGTTMAYGQVMSAGTTLGTAHSVTLSGLAAATTYSFRVKSTDVAGNVSQSENQTFVTPASTPDPGTPAAPPTAGMALWLRADAGMTINAGGVGSWKDQSPSGVLARQSSGSNQPRFISNALNGKPVVRFDGMNDWMAFNLPVNGLSGMTVFLVSSNSANQDGSVNGVEYAPLLWRESATWGTVHVSPFQSHVKFRFGTGETNNLPTYARPASIGNQATITTAVKSGAAESLFVDGAQVSSRQNARQALAGVSPDGYLGRGLSGKTYFPGDIAEIVVYKRALSSEERAQVEAYLKNKYGL